MNHNLLSFLLLSTFSMALGQDKEAAAPKDAAPAHLHETKPPVFTCPRHPNVASPEAGHCPECGRALKLKPGDQAAKVSKGPTIKAKANTAALLEAGKEAEVFIRLSKRDGSPVLPADLLETHTKKVHLLINDESLSDYHHEHPVDTSTPGEYTFRFTPHKPGGYRVWADLHPTATDAQEYVIADIPGAGTAATLTDREVKTTDMVDGLKYEVVFADPKLVAGQSAKVTLKITNADGTAFNQLEPIMGAYAHLVGFAEHFHSIAHLHPMGSRPGSEADRGTGNLEFHMEPKNSGLLRLYAQVQIGGVSKFARFTLQVAEAKD